MIGYSSPLYVRDGKRPSGHGNKGVIKALLDDIQGKKPLTQPEKAAIGLSTATTKKIAKLIKDTNWLSTNMYAVCHKIPYSAVERAFEALLNKETASPGANTNAWDAFDELMNQVYYGNSHGHVGQSTAELLPLIKPGNEFAAGQQANQMLSDFDKDADNLYLGFASTNSSIGENHDLHYDVLTTATGAVAATPRGQAYAKLLNALESALGLSKSSSIEVVDAAGVKWVMTSGVYGTKSADTGYVEAA